MTDKIPTLTFEEAVRTRPGMYFGSNESKGIIKLVCGLLKDCIVLCHTDELFFSMSILKDNTLSMEISSKKDLSPFLYQFDPDAKDFKNFHPKALIAVADHLKIASSDNQLYFSKGKPLQNNSFSAKMTQHNLQLNFAFDTTVFKDTNVDHMHLSEELFQIALLNRKIEILIKDTRQKYLNQNYYYFPQGIFYLYERIKSEVLGKPEFEITFDNKIKENSYQIVIAYRTDWYPQPTVISFANDTHTTRGGSLVAGIMDGLIKGCKLYVEENNRSTYMIKRKEFLNGLIIVCSVRGGDFNYGGSFKETLETQEVRSQVKKLISRSVLDYLQENKEKADKLLWRFDESRFTSRK